MAYVSTLAYSFLRSNDCYEKDGEYQGYLSNFVNNA